MPSFLDVLAPSRVPDPGGFGRRGAADLEAAVRYDLQTLLNAHRPPASLIEGYEELTHSVFNFGLRDYTQVEMMNQQHRDAFARHIGEVIGRFEPRLTDIVITARSPEDVELSSRGRAGKTSLYFHIAARLLGPDGDSEAQFENRFEWASGKHELSS